MKKRHPHKENVLLVNITRLGDMLQSTPTIAGMKLENPDCKITVLVEKQFESVCHIIPNIDEIVAIDLGMTVRSLSREQDGIIDAYEYISTLVDELKEERFDYCLNMSSSAYTAILLNLLEIQKKGGWTADEEGYRIIESEWARLFATSVFHQNRQFNSLNLVDVFRCSADVEKHPNKLQINVGEKDLEYCQKMIGEAGFLNAGPLIAVQAGASQGKRQWATDRFIRMIRILIEKHNARVVLTGTKKELSIVEPIKQGCNSPNVFVMAGKTDIPQLAALLKLSSVLITGDTGPMHISVAVGTPVVANFLASAYGFETGPYSEGNLVLQPVIGCGPCNPNKGCARPDCHDTIDPEVVAELAMMRVQGDVRSIPPGLVSPHRAIVYRSYFDQDGFCNLEPLNNGGTDRWMAHREAYRRLWLDDLGGIEREPILEPSRRALRVSDGGIDGVDAVLQCADRGCRLIDELIQYIRDPYAPPKDLARVNNELSELDRTIEQIGFYYPPLGPVSRMFMFAKENLLGSEALSLASQMGGVYQDLNRRCKKLNQYYQSLC